MSDIKLNPCRYCDGKIKQYTHEGRNFTGRQGYISVCYCTRCGMQVEAFDESPIEAERKSRRLLEQGYLRQEVI